MGIGLWVKRIIVFGILVVVFLFAGLGPAIDYFTKPDTEPTVVVAPWLIQTSSRIYYAKEYSLQNMVPAIRGYWTFDGKHFQYTEGIKNFPPDIYGQIKVIRRATK
jgi:hypothetical protein